MNWPTLQDELKQTFYSKLFFILYFFKRRNFTPFLILVLSVEIVSTYHMEVSIRIEVKKNFY